MKVPVTWLEEYFPSSLDPAEVAERLTLSGIEVERIQGVGAFDPLVVVGEITEISPLTGGAQRLSVLADKARSVVSNAPNLALGKRVALALPSATLFSSHLDELISVRTGEVYGVASEGMLVSQANLGLGEDATEALFFDASVALGLELSTVLKSVGFADRVLELAILPNIARCQSVRGVAREVGALLDRELRALVEPSAYAAERVLSPRIDAADAASVLAVTLLENVEVRDSTRAVKLRLLLAGMTPINNVVDASNYVMLELGQPTHPYDADLLPSLDLGVRRSRAGDRLLTLLQADGDEPTKLPEGIPLITSADAPVALAGVMGGRATAISAKTRRVALEAAAFDYVAIRRSQQAAKIFTEASARFSRGVNPELPQVAARRFVEVLRETSPGLKVVAFGEASSFVPAARRIELSLSELNGSLGADFTLKAADQYLRRIGLSPVLDETRASLSVEVGNARADLTLPCDLVEEVARLAGFDRIPETLPTEPIPDRLHDDTVTRREALRDLLVCQGLQETIAYSLNGPELEARLFAAHPDATKPRAVALLNPVSLDRSQLRTSLLPALLAAVELNLRHSPLCRLFEIGPVFQPKADPREVPVEEDRVSLVLAGVANAASLHEKKPRALDFYDVKALLVELLTSLRLSEGLEFVPLVAPPYQPGAAASIVRNGQSYGTLGAVHPLVRRAFDIESESVFVADLSLARLLADSRARAIFHEYDRLPSIELDIALFVAVATTAADIRRVAREVGGPLLRDVEVFDQFFNAELPEQKSIAIRLRLNAGERTLEMAEAVEVRARVARALEATLHAKIRE